MLKFTGVAAIAILLAGCMMLFESGKEYMSHDAALEKEAALQKAYDQCLKRNGHSEAKCGKEKNDLLQQQEWNEMEESG
jgi:hypothetical protein